MHYTIQKKLYKKGSLQHFFFEILLVVVVLFYCQLLQLKTKNVTSVLAMLTGVSLG